MSRRFSLSEARKVGEKLGINWHSSSFDVKQFCRGMNVELEHGKRNPITNVTHDQPVLTGKIALAHLSEFPDYYIRLDVLEKEARKHHRKTEKNQDT